MEIIAKVRYLRMTPRKVRLLAGLIRGMDIARAEAQLGFTSKAAARPVLKLLRSAVANAEHNFKLDRDDLYIKTITVDGGPVLKRWRSRAFGRASPIRKRTSHIVIILSDDRAEAAKAKAKGRGKKAAAEGKAKPLASGLKAALVKAGGGKKPAKSRSGKEEKKEEGEAEGKAAAAKGKDKAGDKSKTKKSKE